MSKYLRVNINEEDTVAKIGKALENPIRIKILRLLNQESLYIREIAYRLDIPPSSAAMHTKILKDAGLISFEEKPGTRGGQKICRRTVDSVNIITNDTDLALNQVISYQMPVGGYAEISVAPTCGLWSEKGVIGEEDQPFSFYLPEHAQAQIIWSAAGYVEYHFPYRLPDGDRPECISISMEICSEAANFREDWKSDITFALAGVELGTWTSPGDYGARRGRLNPKQWDDGSTQYGILLTLEVRDSGFYINKEKYSDVGIHDLRLDGAPYIPLWIGNKPDAKYVGGFNLFGRSFGDYQQDIIMNIEYSGKSFEQNN